VELVLFPSKIQLGKLIGVKEAAVVVLTEDSFAGRVKELINSGGE
jgi:ribosomal protein L7Ae-like RNA K-turn-binding protein